jgi:HSP20 family protein
MAENKDIARAPARTGNDAFGLLRQLTSELDRAFDDPLWPRFGLPALGTFAAPLAAGWSPRVDVFEKENRLVTKVDLPGVKKEDVTVEVTDGHLTLSGERKRESEQTKDGVYRAEREHGSFYRAVPLPQGVKLEDVKASFADGVLEVSVPLPVRPEAKVRKVDIQEPAKPATSAA